MNQNKDDLLKDQLTRIKLLLNDLQIKDQQLEILKAKLIDLDEENNLLITRERMNEETYEENVNEFRRIQRQNIEKIAYMEEKNKDLEYLQNENFLLQEELGRRREEEEKMREEEERRREEEEEKGRVEEEMKNIIQRLEKESELFIEKINALESENAAVLTRLADLAPIPTLLEEEKASSNLLNRRVEELEEEGNRRDEGWRRAEEEWRREEEGWEEERKKFERLFYEYNLRLMEREGKAEDGREEGKSRLEGMEEELRILKEMLDSKDQNIDQLRQLFESERDSSLLVQSDLQVLLHLLQSPDKKVPDPLSFRSQNKDILNLLLTIITKKLKSRVKYKKSYGKLRGLLVEKEEVVERLAEELEGKRKNEEKEGKELDLEAFSRKIEEVEKKLKEKELEFFDGISQKENEIQSLAYSLSTHVSLLRQKEEEKAELLSILNQQVQANGAYGFTFGHSQMNWEEDEEGRREEGSREDEGMRRREEEIRRRREEESGRRREGGGEGEEEGRRTENQGKRREEGGRREEEGKRRENGVRRREKEGGGREMDGKIREEGLALAGMVKMMCYLLSLVRRMKEIKEIFKEFLEIGLRMVKKIDKIGAEGGRRKRRMKTIALSILFLKFIGGGRRRKAEEGRRKKEEGRSREEEGERREEGGRKREGEGGRRREEEGGRRREEGFYKNFENGLNIMDLIEQLESDQAKPSQIKLNFKRTMEKLKEIKRKSKKEFLWSIRRKDKMEEGKKEINKDKVK